MMRELAKAAADPDESIRELIIATGKTIPDEHQNIEYAKSIRILRNADFLPCRSPRGKLMFQPLVGTFFIFDDQEYSKLFADRLCTIDFSYQELTSLHKLFRLLGLQDHYLSRHVKVKTVEGQTSLSQSLTRQLRDCAYALSW